LKNKHIIIYTFQSLEDPLVKGLILEYLKGINATQTKFIFHLITHEQKEFSLNKQQLEEHKTMLGNYRIKWYPIKYRGGSFILLKKIYNFLQTLFIATGIKLKYKPVAILGFLSIAGAYSYILSGLLNLKLIIYCFEPHSEYMLDFKIWTRGSLKYKLLKRFERLQVKNSDFIVVPNQFTKSLIEPLKKENVFVCPISIDTDKMTFNSDSRQKIRKKLNIENRRVIIYTGKFNGIYYSSDTVIEFFKRLHSVDETLFFYVITQNTEDVKQSIEKYKLPINSFHLSFTVNYNELNNHISAADIGFVALPPLPSQKYRTPVKSAIYLSCGLPYIVNAGIGEDDIIASDKKVGIVIENIDEASSDVISKINELLSGDAANIHIRCRLEAQKTRTIKAALEVLNKIFAQL
jgi:glycosyltransferase involved in cell wall biosynthesis